MRNCRSWSYPPSRQPPPPAKTAERPAAGRAPAELRSTTILMSSGRFWSAAGLGRLRWKGRWYPRRASEGRTPGLASAVPQPPDAESASPASPLDEDAARLRELGYGQELRRRLRGVDNVAMGFATISPGVGLYAVVLVGMTVAGPAWLWVLPIALAGQCLLLVVYSELAAEFPITGGPYQWSRRLVGGAYGWFNGWVAVSAYAVANTTVAYLGAPWALTLLEIDVTPAALVVAGMVLVIGCALVGAAGIRVLKRAVQAGILAETTALLGIGFALLLVFREQDFSIVTETLGAEASSGSVAAGMLAALAVGGWVFIGFDACVAGAEETRDPTRHVPRALWIAI